MASIINLDKITGGYTAVYDSQRCSKCILSSDFPGISFDDKGICNICYQDESKSENQDVRDSSYNEVLNLVNNKPERDYDCLVLYSGGKDSSYSLYVIKKILKLRPLALTIDNSFISQAVLPNMKAVLNSLDIDHIIFRPSYGYMKSMYKVAIDTTENDKENIKYATSACGSCISTVLSIGAREAVKRNIPVLMGGWSPGQLTEKSLLPGAFLEKICQQHFTKMALSLPALQPQIAQYFRKTSQYPALYNPLYNIKYNENTLISDLETLGWKRPVDTDSCSSNCKLNGLLVIDHIKKYGFHPYEYELAFHVRNGFMKRDEALEKITNISFSSKTLEEVTQELD